MQIGIDLTLEKSYIFIFYKRKSRNTLNSINGRAVVNYKRRTLDAYSYTRPIHIKYSDVILY